MAGRRGHGEGSIYKRANGTWAAQIDVGRKPDGTRDRRTVYGRTKKEVSEKLLTLQKQAGAGLIADPGRQTVEEYLERWLKNVAAPRLRAVTVQSYRQSLKVDVLPFIGHLRLANLTGPHLQQLCTDLLDAGKSRRTVQYAHSILRRAFNKAVAQGVLARNPTDGVDAPKPERRDMTVLTPDQLQDLMAALEGDALEAFYLLAIATGCRRGELVALRWQDVNLSFRQPGSKPGSKPGGLVHINRTAELVAGDVVWSEPKTAKSRRAIPIPPDTVAILKAHKAQQNDDRVRNRLVWEDGDLVFCKPNGAPLDPGHVTQHFTHLVKKYGLHKVRLHDLRHTHATMLMGAGIHPKIVSERLGHSTTTLTLDTYSHVLPTMQEAVTQTLDVLLQKRGSGRHKSS